MRSASQHRLACLSILAGLLLASVLVPSDFLRRHPERRIATTGERCQRIAGSAASPRHRWPSWRRGASRVS